MGTAADDELIVKNPCRVPGAGVEHAPERPVPSAAEVATLVGAMPARWRLLPDLAAWCSLRRGELLGLRRCDFDLLHGTVTVEQVHNYLDSGKLVVGPPKTAAGRRTVTIPPHLVPQVIEHLEAWVGPEPDALAFAGQKGGPLLPGVLQGAWDEARRSTGLVHLHLHDLRHAGNTWAAATPGASTKDLMARMGHASPRAALLYQHATQDRAAVIAAALSDLAAGAEVVQLVPGEAAGNPAGATPPATNGQRSRPFPGQTSKPTSPRRSPNIL